MVIRGRNGKKHWKRKNLVFTGKEFSHEEVLRKLLNDLLPVQVGAIEYLPNEIPVLSEKDKRSSGMDPVLVTKYTGLSAEGLEALK